MTDPQRYPVETARKKIADILDGTQFRGEHAEITRRDKSAAYLVPPEWYRSITKEVEELRQRVKELDANKEARPAVATPRARVTQALPKPEPIDLTGISPAVAALPLERVRSLAASAEARQPKWVAEIREEYPDANELRLCYLIVDVGFRQGHKPPELADTPTPDTSERPVGSEETSA